MPYRHNLINLNKSPGRGFGLYSLLLITMPFQASPLLAQEDWELAGEDYLTDLPVVLTVTRLPQSKVELPTAVTVIDREMIDASGAVTLTELFHLVAGFQVGHYHGTDGSRTVVTYHGNTNQYARRMQVLIDGRSVYTWGTGGAEWNDLPLSLDDVERIEVSRGPNGVTYGSNAFLGVINIITRHSSEQRGAHLRLTADDDEYREGVVRYGGGSGDFTYRLTGRYQRDDGFEPYNAGGSTIEQNDDASTNALAFRGDLRAGVNDYLTMQMGWAAGPREVGETTDTTSPPRDREVTTHYQQLQWKHILSSENEINVQIYHNLHSVKDHFVTEPLPFILLDVDTSMQSERYDVELSHQLRLHESLRMVWGVEARIDEVKGEDYFDLGDTYRQQLTRAFINGEWRPVDKWIVNLGEMIENSDQFGTYHSPRLAINRQVGKRGYVRASGGRAYRIPTAVEDNADFTYRDINGTLIHDAYDHAPDLEPERIDSRELAFGAEGKNGGYEVKLFQEEITSEIDAVKDLAPVWLFDHWVIMNVGDTTTRGFELQLKAKTEDALASIAYSHAEASGERLFRINPDTWESTSETVPSHTINALLSLRLAPRLWGSINYYHATPMTYYSGDRTDGVQIADVSFRQGFTFGGHEGSASLLFKNLLGSYHDFEDETVSRRAAYLSVQFDL